MTDAADKHGPRHLAEDKFSGMVTGALQAHDIERHLRAILERAAGSNGRSGLISLPGGGPPVRLNVPSAQELGLVTLQALHVALQTARITLVALNDIDTRLRPLLETYNQAATTTADNQAGEHEPEAQAVSGPGPNPRKPEPTTTGTAPAPQG